MARADRAEEEAARLRRELEAAKAAQSAAKSPAPAYESILPKPKSVLPKQDQTVLVMIAFAILAPVVIVGGLFLFAARATVTTPETVGPAVTVDRTKWLRASPAVEAATALASHEGFAIEDLECASIANGNDPNAYMCRGYADPTQCERLSKASGLSRLDPSVAVPKRGCAALAPYVSNAAVERFGPLGAASAPKAASATIALLYRRTETNAVCFEIDYAAK
jgi:hypothetical protein